MYGNVYLLADGSNTWTPVSTGWPNSEIRTFAMIGTIILAATSTVGAWLRNALEV